MGFENVNGYSPEAACAWSKQMPGFVFFEGMKWAGFEEVKGGEYRVCS
jgi:hypothetical protein